MSKQATVEKVNAELLGFRSIASIPLTTVKAPPAHDVATKRALAAAWVASMFAGDAACDHGGGGK